MKIIAYYTCFFGSEANCSFLIPDVPSQTADCYYFTNNTIIYEYLQNTKFIRVFIDYIPVYNDDTKDTESTKEIRTCPHRFPILRDYMYLCWHDSKLNVFEDKIMKNLVLLDSMSDKVFMATKHPYSDTHKSVWDEFNLCVTSEKYRKEMEKYIEYINSRISAGYSETNEIFYCGGWRLTKQCALAVEFGEFWLKEIQACGIEDQISLQFVVQKYGQYIYPLPYQETWKYCFE
jgi:hypothetical protein